MIRRYRAPILLLNGSYSHHCPRMEMISWIHADQQIGTASLELTNWRMIIYYSPYKEDSWLTRKAISINSTYHDQHCDLYLRLDTRRDIVEKTPWPTQSKKSSLLHRYMNILWKTTIVPRQWLMFVKLPSLGKLVGKESKHPIIQ